MTPSEFYLAVAVIVAIQAWSADESMGPMEAAWGGLTWPITMPIIFLYAILDRWQRRYEEARSR